MATLIIVTQFPVAVSSIIFEGPSNFFTVSAIVFTESAVTMHGFTSNFSMVW